MASNDPETGLLNISPQCSQNSINSRPAYAKIFFTMDPRFAVNLTHSPTYNISFKNLKEYSPNYRNIQGHPEINEEFFPLFT